MDGCSLYILMIFLETDNEILQKALSIIATRTV